MYVVLSEFVFWKLVCKALINIETTVSHHRGFTYVVKDVGLCDCFVQNLKISDKLKETDFSW